MDDKNRFSILLEHLLEVAEVKNYTLAKRLQYDVSYISKWVSGRMLPAKKTEKRVMEGISACVVDEATDDGRNLLLREYSVSIPSDLKAAIYDNLIAEYDYLQEELDSGEARIGPYTDFWAELNMLQYLTKMAHPVLRRVSQLDIVAVMDLMVQPLENIVADADIKGIKDEFFVIVPDDEHEGCFLPYLYVQLKDGYTLDDVRDKINACLPERYMRPVEIFTVPERPFFHFKTNRIGLSKEIIAKRNQQKEKAKRNSFADGCIA